jgi:hypothetical protein
MLPLKKVRALFFGIVCFTLANNSFSQSTIVSYGSSWKYLDNGTNQGTAWRASGFNDASWASGNGELGYGDGDETTVVSYGGNASSKYITTYFRKTITIADPTIYTNFTFTVLRDDGYVVYVNGVEVGRDNMGAAAISSSTTAASAIEDGTVSFNVASSSFSAGSNTIAVEIHQASVTSSDISFDLQLVGNDAFASSLSRGPYLQMGNTSSITIRWKTSTSSNSRVELGTTFGTYPTVVSDPTSTTDHIVNITGLTADTKYFYRIGNTTNMGTADAEKFFTTLPPANTTRKIRIAAFGDCGRNDNSFQSQTLSQYQSYLSTNSIDAPDALLLLGDNGYNAGLETEYTSNFFSAYGSSILKNHKVYATPGNHDYANNATRQNDHVVPYYDIFINPTAAEIGGVSSGTEAYYSFNIGDIHFMALDGYGKENSSTRIYDTTGAQAVWVKADLAANTKKWTIAYWHHPPYTKGSHDSDTEPELIGVRENFIRILERNGVDMIINGHSHDYERSYLLKGYYKVAAANPNLAEVDFVSSLHTASTSSAKYDNSASSCPYTYNSGKYNHGTVYVVAGSSGADGGVQANYPHNAFPFSQDDGGMLYFEIDNNRLDAKFIRRDGVIADKFTILKDVNKKTTVNAFVGVPVTLSASWPGNYVWSTTATTSSINVTPSSVGSVDYLVRDNVTCIGDTFTVVSTALLASQLIDFSIKENNQGILLNWTTANETNTKQFRLMRSADGGVFDKIGEVTAKNVSGENHYSFIDMYPFTGTGYYQLVQENMDGKTQVLETKKITTQRPKNISMSVVSASDNRLVIRIESGEESNVSAKILAQDGKVMSRKQYMKLKGVVSQQINLNAGIYFCEIRNQQGAKIVKQVVVH